MTITIHSPAYAKEYTRPIPDDYYGMLRFSYGGRGEYLLPYEKPMSIAPVEVVRVIDKMQAVVGLSGLGDYEIVLLDAEIKSAQDPASWNVAGERFPGFIVLGGVVDSVEDIVIHELTHELLAQYVTRLEEDSFFTLVGQLRGDDTDDDWASRPQERLAEYVSTALWDQPFSERILAIAPDVLERVKVWALAEFGEHPKAEVVIDDVTIITMQIGNPIATVRGTMVTLDSPPVIINDRTMVPIRFIAEAFGADVSWDGASRTVTITKE